MTMAANDSHGPAAALREERRSDCAAGAWLAVASLLSVALMAFHPTVRSRVIAEVLAELVAKGLRDRLVHGGLIALTAITAVAWWRLLERLDLRGTTARLAAAALLLGTLGYVGAALVNGFALPGLAARYLARPSEELAGAVDLLRLCGELNQALAKLGVIAWATALLLASSVIVRRGRLRGLGIAGMGAGAILAAAIGGGLLPLHLHGMAAVVLLQSAWNGTAAALLIRGYFSSRSATSSATSALAS